MLALSSHPLFCVIQDPTPSSKTLYSEHVFPHQLWFGIENPLHYAQRSISQVILDSVKFIMNMINKGYGLMILKKKKQH